MVVPYLECGDQRMVSPCLFTLFKTGSTQMNMPLEIHLSPPPFPVGSLGSQMLRILYLTVVWVLETQVQVIRLQWEALLSMEPSHQLDLKSFLNSFVNDLKVQLRSSYMGFPHPIRMSMCSSSNILCSKYNACHGNSLYTQFLFIVKPLKCLY